VLKVGLRRCFGEYVIEFFLSCGLGGHGEGQGGHEVLRIMEREGWREGGFRRIGGMRGRCGLAFWKRDGEFCTHEDKTRMLFQGRPARVRVRVWVVRVLREAEKVGYWLVRDSYARAPRLKV
jgi:hypothetical protein